LANRGNETITTAATIALSRVNHTFNERTNALSIYSVLRACTRATDFTDPDWLSAGGPVLLSSTKTCVTVQTTSTTRDLTLIQQNTFYWISNRSGVAELVCTKTWVSQTVSTAEIKLKLKTVLSQPKRRPSRVPTYTTHPVSRNKQP